MIYRQSLADVDEYHNNFKRQSLDNYLKKIFYVYNIIIPPMIIPKGPDFPQASIKHYLSPFFKL